MLRIKRNIINKANINMNDDIFLEVVELHDLSHDESLLKVTVDTTGSLQSRNKQCNENNFIIHEI